jgi:hypothetical protein
MKILRDYPYVPYSNELTDRMVDTRRTMHPWNFVAFTSKAVPEIGPSVRFYGGTAATGITPCAPSMAFDIYGNCEVIIGEWMNEENCPNVYDSFFVGKVVRFVQENLPILYLVYLGSLPVANAMDYFTGKDEWTIMLTGIKDVSDDIYLWLQYAKNPLELHKRIFEAGLYQKLCLEESSETFSERICPLLKSFEAERYEADIWSDEWYLVKYNGNSPYVTIPEDFAVIGEAAFMGHGELRQVRLHNGCVGIDERSFAGCANLVTINFPEACDWIGRNAFAECINLQIASLPPRAWIGEGAFQYCTSLQVLEISEGVAEIEENAFLGCTNLIILCKENSCAHYYAQEHGIRFELQE